MPKKEKKKKPLTKKPVNKKPVNKKQKQKQKQQQKVIVNLTTTGGGSGGSGERTVYLPNPIHHQNAPIQQHIPLTATNKLETSLESLTNKLGEIQSTFRTPRTPAPVERMPERINTNPFQTPARQNESLLEFQENEPLFKSEREPLIKPQSRLKHQQAEPAKKRGRPVGAKNKPKQPKEFIINDDEPEIII